MKKALALTILPALMLSFSSPSAFGDDWDHNHGNHHGDHGHGDQHHPNGWHDDHRHDQQQIIHEEHKLQQAQNNDWKWEKHNWNEQRSQLRSDWKTRRARMSAIQQQQVDDQMKAQWLAYHHNKWNGQYSWDQYNDPAFLDYLHTKNPTLLTQVRSFLGF